VVKRIFRQRVLVARLGSGPLLELFLILSVVTVLVIRAVLAATGYPQLGGHGLHIAHMLWGGLIMMAAVVLLIAALGRFAVVAGAVLGAIGFGFFIDEVGKFVTSDNDYFFRPAISIMYVLFVLLFLLFRAIGSIQPSPQTSLANAFAMTADAVVDGLDPEKEKKAHAYLQNCDPADPMVAALGALLDQAVKVPQRRPGLPVRMAQGLRAVYRRIMNTSAFKMAVVAVFAFLSILGLVEMGILVFAGGGSLEFAQWAQIVSTVVAGVLVVLGVLRLRRSRLAAYRMFLRAVLMSLLVSQVFAFYREQWAGLVGLGLGLLVWAAVRYLIAEEESIAEV
jgi:hypothetical protein